MTQSKAAILGLFSAYITRLDMSPTYGTEWTLEPDLVQSVAGTLLSLFTNLDQSDHNRCLWDHCVDLLRGVPPLLAALLGRMDHRVTASKSDTSPNEGPTSREIILILCRILAVSKLHFLFRQNETLCSQLYKALSLQCAQSEVSQLMYNFQVAIGDTWLDQIRSIKN